MDKQAIKVWVGGRVQGVYFRVSTQQCADRLGLTGYAKNLADGRVEIVAEGAPAEVDTLLSYLAKGPPGARVDTLEKQSVALANYLDFKVL